MAYEQKPNTGTLFRNDKKPEGSSQPDYRGSVNVEGHEYELAAWIKDGKNGKFMSLSLKEPYQKSGGGAPAGGGKGGTFGDDDDLGIPF